MKLPIIMIFGLILSLSGIVESAEMSPVYNLSVSFDIENNLLKAAAQITVSEGGERNISVGELRIVSVEFNGQPLEPALKGGAFKIIGQGILEIIYEGYFREEQQLPEIENIENVGVVSKNIITDKGISLTSGWYPSFDGMANWNLKATFPKGFKAMIRSR